MVNNIEMIRSWNISLKELLEKDHSAYAQKVTFWLWYNLSMKKDNLTDVVQAIPKTPVNTQVTPQQLVTTNEGDIVTLGKK